MNLTDSDDCRENYPFLPAATSKYFCAKINWLWSFWVQIVVNVHIYVQMMETVKSLQNRVKSLEEEVSRRRWVAINYNHCFCFYRILQWSTGLLSIYLAIYLAVVFFPPWIIYSGRASLFSTSSTIYNQHFWRNSCNRERKMMSIWAQGCLLGNSGGEAPICHGPIIDVGHQMQLHTSAAVSHFSAESLIPFDFWLILQPSFIHDDDITTHLPNALQCDHLPNMAIGEPSPQSGRRQVPSLGQVESSTGTRPRNYNLQSSATSLTCTQRWNRSPIYITKLENSIVQVRQNRKDIDKKCPKSKCEKMLKKVKKVKASVEFIQTTNITELENLVVMLQNSPAGNTKAKQKRREKRNKKSQKYLQAISLQN